MRIFLSAALLAWVSVMPLMASLPPARPNIILITIDTLRADHVGCYGAAGVQTSTLDGLARDGIVFERAIAQVPLTYPSHASIMTGLYPFQTGAQDFTSSPLDPHFRTVAQALHDHGYSTGAVVSSFALDHSWGLARGFDSYDDAFSQESYRKRDLGLVERRADESVTRALRWLQTMSRRPFFFWLHLYDPHSPYDPPEPFRTKFSDRPYDGEVAYADQQLGRLVDWLKTTRLYDKTLIIVVSDHGESLGDHGEKEHGFFLYNSTLHVPLIVKPPAKEGYRPERIQDVIEIAGIPATILNLAHISDSLSKAARPGLMSEAVGTRTAYSETFYPFNSFGWSPLHSLQSRKFHFIDAPEPELYDVDADPREIQNLAPGQAATASVMRQKLQMIVRAEMPKAEQPRVGLSEEAQQRLRALGYFAYRSPVPQSALLGELADPKSKLAEFNALLSAQDAIHAGDFERGQALLKEVRQKDPGMYIVPFYLGEAALAQQQWSEAATEFKICLQLSPQFEQAMTGVARALMFQGKTDEAKDWAKKVLEINSQSYQALYILGFLESGANRSRAIEYYKRAVVIQPNYAPLQRDLGLLELQEGHFAESARYLGKTVDLGIVDASILNSLGIAFGRIGQFDDAVEAYRRALALDPNVAEIHLNLASAYDRLQRPKQARAEHEAACKLNVRYCH